VHRRGPSVSTFSVTADLSGLRKRMNTMVVGCGEAARPAAQAGAQVFYDRVRELVPTSLKGHWFHGTSFQQYGTKYWFDAGNLKDAIYQVYSKDNSGKNLATYHIAWNHKEAPYGFMVEFGTSKAPAHPFLRPARAEADKVRKAVYDRYLAELKSRGILK
jgi:HK97 gp10 family phage protein